jgi:hypothetical protein
MKLEKSGLAVLEQSTCKGAMAIMKAQAAVHVDAWDITILGTAHFREEVLHYTR